MMLFPTSLLPSRIRDDGVVALTRIHLSRPPVEYDNLPRRDPDVRAFANLPRHLREHCVSRFMLRGVNCW